MTDWLKKADAPSKGQRIYNDLEPWLLDCKNAKSDMDIASALTQLKVNVARELELLLDTKEGSIFDNPEYQREQENVGDSGDFDPAHILDSQPKSNFTSDPGPASTTPGAPGTSVAPGTGLAEGLFD